MFNQTIILGNLGKDPVLKEKENGIPYVYFPVVTVSHWINANGEKQEKKIWFKVKCFGKQALNYAKFLHKGSLILAVGEIDNSVWLDEASGEVRSSLELNVTRGSIQFVSDWGESNGF